MILWLVLFSLVLAISFVLAMQSMKDYQEIPHKSETQYGLFLIRKTENFNTDFLNSLRENLLADSLIVSLERLFKGKKAALTIFGPIKILDKFSSQLDLLELEDYTKSCNGKDVSAWEVGIKDAGKFESLNTDKIFGNLPDLEEEDQFFWQVILNAKGGESEKSFQTQIRAAVFTKDSVRRDVLVHLFQNIKLGELIKIPKPFTSEQMMTFFKLRSLSRDSQGPLLDSFGVMNLLKI